jgi:hypothetical protein
VWRNDLSRLTAALVFGMAVSASVAQAEASVKVECWGNSCSNVTLRDACNAYKQSSVPVAITCDDLATPGGGTQTSCVGGAQTCVVDEFDQFQTVGRYCQDGGGFDAIVFCR